MREKTMPTTLINNMPKTAVNCNDHLSENPFLFNCWYVGAWPHEVQGDDILARQFLSKRVIFFRDSKVDVSALEDRCSHRFAPLSVGRHTGDDVRCMYHEVIEIANDIEYGLTGYVWTENSSKGMRVAKKLEAGMIWVNSENNRHLPAPFGGMKSSGIGRDGGDWSFDFYMEMKNTCVAYGTHSIPKLGK